MKDQASKAPLPRLIGVYELACDPKTARSRAQGIALEQTVELPDRLVPDGFIRDHIVGQIEEITPLSSDASNNPRAQVKISYDLDSTGHELSQTLNLLFGNTSIKSGVKWVDLEVDWDRWTRSGEVFPGPRWGVDELRQRVGTSGALIQSALKPMGLSPKELAQKAYLFAKGGVHIIKDDHGLSNQPWAPFKDRVRACVEAVERANHDRQRDDQPRDDRPRDDRQRDDRRGLTHSLYAPHICGEGETLIERAIFAQKEGAGALLVCPGLVGWGAISYLATETNLPIIAHPALLGGSLQDPLSGVSHALWLGKLPRLCGASSSIFPNVGGRFGFTQTQCLEIAQACRSPLAHFKPIFPTPGGGMTIDRVPDMRRLYGEEVMYLMGGGLYELDPQLDRACHMLSEALRVEHN